MIYPLIELHIMVLPFICAPLQHLHLHFTPTPKIDLPALWVAHHGVTIHLRPTSTRWLSIAHWATRSSATIVRSGGLGQGHGLWAWCRHGNGAWPGPGGHWHWGWWGWSEAAFGFATVVAAAAYRGVRLGPVWWALIITSILQGNVHM